MTRNVLATLALGTALAAAMPASAAITISNTGTGNWTAAGGSNPGYSGTAVTVGPNLPAFWEANTAASQWVSINAQGTSTGSPATVNGNYTYSTTLTGAAGDTLNFRYWADDQVVSYTLDGVTTAVNAGTFATSTLGSFTLVGGDTSAVRSLAFTVVNSGTPSGGNPTGFRFEQVAGAVPEPATWAMMVMGFGVVGFGMRRRKSVKTTVQFA